jgi:hypothetical protein
MAELATRDSGPPPADLPRGECILTRLPDGSFRIDHADPRVLISAGLLYEFTDTPVPGVSLRWPAPPPASGRFLYNGAILTIHGANRTVIYRIGEYVPRVHGYIGEWPD